MMGGNPGISEERCLGGSGRITLIPRRSWVAFIYPEKYFNNNPVCIKMNNSFVLGSGYSFFPSLSCAISCWLHSQSLFHGCKIIASDFQGYILPHSHSAKRSKAFFSSSPRINPEICYDWAGWDLMLNPNWSMWLGVEWGEWLRLDHVSRHGSPRLSWLHWNI